MFPQIVDIGELFGLSFSLPIHTYGVLLATGFLAGIALAAARAGRYGIAREDVYVLMWWILGGVIIGGKLLLIIVDPAGFLANPMGIVRAGGVFYGGFIGAVAGAIWFFRSRKIKVLAGGDLMAPSIALGHAIGRLGCFSAGCCYGSPAGGAPGITFSDIGASGRTGVPLGVPLHPTQLYEAGLELLLFVGLLWLAARRPRHGVVFFTWMGLYAVGRFMIEFLRGDARGFVFDGLLSTSQFVGVGMFLVAVAGLVMLRSRPAASR